MRDSLGQVCDALGFLFMIYSFSQVSFEISVSFNTINNRDVMVHLKAQYDPFFSKRT